MSGEAVERRKSTRNRGEPPMKLRRTSSVQDVLATTTPNTRRTSEKKTPAKGTPRGKPGPKPKVKEIPQPQTPEPEPEEEVLPEIQESMATMMDKSRQRWLNEGGIFDRFWTKPPRKRKGQPAVEMPSKAQMSMIEIGQTRIIIEPHVFDIHMYGVKKPALSWQPPIGAPTTGGSNNASTAQQRPMQNPYPRPGATQPIQSPSTGPHQPASQKNQRGIALNPYAMPSSGQPGKQSKPETISPEAPSEQPAHTAVAPVPTQSDTLKTQASSQHQTATSTTTPTQISKPASHDIPPSQAQKQVQNQSTQGQTTASTTANGASGAPSRVSTPPANPVPAPAVVQNQSDLPPAPIQAPAPRAQTARPAQPAKQQPPPQQTAPHPDPVIQLLAQRASSDPALKELMKIVAAGSTSKEKLAEFQKHIDEINEIVKRQQLNRGSQAQQKLQATATGQSSQRQSQQQHRAQPFIASKPAAPPPPRHDFADIAFDFVRGSDCYLLPRSSIVQHLPDGMTTLISFIVTRKGKDVPESALKPDVEYYQPMTITLLTVEQKIRDAITQVVLPKDQVNREMKEVMERCTLAPTRGMMLDVPDAHNVIATASEENENETVKTQWDAPNSLIPLR